MIKGEAELQSFKGRRSMVQRTASVDKIAVFYFFLAACAALAGGGVSSLQLAGMLPVSGFLNVLEHYHAVLMLFFVVVPALVGGFGTAWLPAALEQKQVVTPRLNGVACLCMVAAGLMLVGTSWTVAAMITWCAGALLSAMVLLATIFDSCADASGSRRFTPFVWGQMLASVVLLFTVPVLAATLSHYVPEGQNVSLSALAGFAAPLSVVILLSGFGIVFEAVARTVSLPLRSVVIVMAGTAMFSTVLWVRSVLFPGQAYVSALTHLLPFSDMVLNIATLGSILLAGLWIVAAWRVRLELKVPVLWGLGFLLLVGAGWVSQFMQGEGLHPALQAGALYAVFCGIYLWRGEGCQRWYPRSLAVMHFVTMSVAMALAVPAFFAASQLWSGVFFTLSALCFLACMGLSFVRNRPADESSFFLTSAFSKKAEAVIHE